MLNRKEAAFDKKGKEAEIQKWEAEVRQTLANKKTGANKLSKEEEALVRSQLAKEKDIRQEVDALRLRLAEGLQVVHSLVDIQLEAFQHYISRLTTLLLSTAVGRPSELLGDAPFDAFLVSEENRPAKSWLIEKIETRSLLRGPLLFRESVGWHSHSKSNQLSMRPA